MAWIVGIDSYRAIEFENIDNYVVVCVNNRDCHDQKLEEVRKCAFLS